MSRQPVIRVAAPHKKATESCGCGALIEVEYDGLPPSEMERFRAAHAPCRAAALAPGWTNSVPPPYPGRAVPCG